MRRNDDTEFPNGAAIRAAELIANGQTESHVDEFADALRELYGFGGDEALNSVRKRRRRQNYEPPSPEGRAALATIRAYLDSEGGEDLRAKCAASEDGVEEYGFSIFLFLLLQVIAVYIRRWLEKVLP